MYDPDEKYPIINVPDSQKKLTLRLEWAATFIATLLVWFFFLRYIYRELTQAGTATSEMMAYLGLVFSLALGLLLYWQVFNFLMYGKRGRRKAFPDPPVEAVAALYGISATDFMALKQPKEVSMQFENEKYYLRLSAKQRIYLGLFDEEVKALRSNNPLKIEQSSDKPVAIAEKAPADF